MGFWAYGLFDLDEGFYAAVVSEMNARGEWITPYYNGSAWFEKPILLYWAAKPAVMAFGEMIGPRLPSVLSNLALYAFCGWFISRRVSPQAGRLTIYALGSSLLLVATGRMMLTDPLLNLCMTVAFLSFLESLIGDSKWRLLSAVALGFAVLAKGPVGLPLFLAVAIWTYVAEPDLRAKFKGWWLLGVLLLFGVVSLWYLPAYLQNGKLFVDKFLLEQNIGRFTGGDKAHATPIYLAPIYYPVILFLSMLPWSISAIKGWPKKQEGDIVTRFLGRYALVILIFFTISSAKLPHYILPAAPPLAMLASIHLAKKREWSLLPTRAWVTIGVATILSNLGFILYYNQFHREVHDLARFAKAQGGEVAAYQMPRREKGLGTGKLKIQETSHPSLQFYLGKPFLEAESLDDLYKRHEPVWIITRWDRITADQLKDAEQHGFNLEKVEPVKPDYYALYKLTPRQ